MTVVPDGHPFVYVAYFAPFSYEQHQHLIADCAAAVDHDGKPMCTIETIATTKQENP